MKPQISVKHIVIDLIYLSNQLKDLYKGNSEYLPIIDFLYDKDYLNDELDIPFPKLKDLEEATGIKPHILRKLLLKMHNEVFNSESKVTLNFTKVLYRFYMKFYDQSCYFEVDHLPHLPRIGENINLPFTKSCIDINSFYVENIIHELINDTQVISLWLKVGNYNEYWRFMKDRAIELREVGFKELHEFEEDVLKQKIYSNSRNYNRRK